MPSAQVVRRSLNIYFLVAGFAKDITPQSLVSLLNLKSNLIIALSSKQTPLSSLASEFSLILPPPGTPLISYFPKRDESAALIPILPSSQDTASNILSKNLSPVWFSGIPLSLGNNPFLVPILHAPLESFASEVDGGAADAIVDAAERGGEGLWAGSRLSVVTGFQALNGARVTWVGGVDIFSDEFAQKEVSKWFSISFIFQEVLTDILTEELNLVMHNSAAMLLRGLSRSLLSFVSTEQSITASTLQNLLNNILQKTSSWVSCLFLRTSC